jgi:hypothetical protein
MSHKAMCKDCVELREVLERVQQALLSATGVLRESSDPKAREAAQVLYQGVRRSGKARPREPV